MDPFAVSHFSNDALLCDLKTQVVRDRTTTAVLLTRIAEVDARKLYRQEGFPSMHAYCVHELHFSEGAAYKRINAARAGRRFPVIFVALAEGRVHLSAVVTLAAYLTSGNVDELLAAATHKTRAGVEQLIADRFPRPDLPERLQTIPAVVLPTVPAQGTSVPRGKLTHQPFRPRSPSQDLSVSFPRSELDHPCREPGWCRWRRSDSGSRSRSTRKPMTCCSTPGR